MIDVINVNMLYCTYFHDRMLSDIVADESRSGDLETGNPTYRSELNGDDDIEESDKPHLLWGLQGSTHVYCSLGPMSQGEKLKRDKALLSSNDVATLSSTIIDTTITQSLSLPLNIIAQSSSSSVNHQAIHSSSSSMNHQAIHSSSSSVNHQTIHSSSSSMNHQATHSSSSSVNHQATQSSSSSMNHQATQSSSSSVNHQATHSSSSSVNHQATHSSSSSMNLLRSQSSFTKKYPIRSPSKGSRKRNQSSSLSIAPPQPIYSGPALFPPPQVTSKEVPAAVKRILNHRLFQGWMISSAVAEDEDEADNQALVPEASSPKRQKIAPVQSQQRQVPEAPKTQPLIPVVHIDDEIPVFPMSVPLGDRIRKAVWRGKAVVSVRLDGGWLATPQRKRIRSVGGNSRATLSIYSGVGINGGIDCSKKLFSNHHMSDDASSIRARVLSKAADRRHSISLSALFESKVIQAAVQSAQTYAHKKKHVQFPSSLHMNRGSAHDSIVRKSYLMKPSMTYVPAEDGGLRYASVSSSVVPRSLHELCMKNLLCGYCMSNIDIIDTDNPKRVEESNETESKSSKVKQKNKSKSTDDDAVHSSATIDVERCLSLVPFACGSVTYQLHKQCAHALLHHRDLSPTVTSSSPDTAAAAVARKDVDVTIHRSGIKLGAIYQYEQCDDADCDICGRKGGILRYFEIDAERSSFPKPSSDGWLAHTPCIEYLQTSGLLTPLEPSSSSFQANRFSCVINANGGSNGDSKLSPLETSVNGRRKHMVFRRSNDVDGSIALRQDEMDGSIALRQDEMDGSIALRQDEMDGSIALIQDEMDGSIALRQDEMDGSIALRQDKIDGSIALRQDEMDDSIALRQDEMDGSIALRQDEMDGSIALRQDEMDGSITLRQDEMNGSIALRQDELDGTSCHNLERVSHRLLSNDCLSPYFPQSRFDQLYGHWRCALCGIHSGIVSRCIAACCTVRAHYLCASLAEANNWQLHRIVSSRRPRGSPLQQQQQVPIDDSSSAAEELRGDVTLGIVCSLHAFK